MGEYFESWYWVLLLTEAKWIYSGNNPYNRAHCKLFWGGFLYDSFTSSLDKYFRRETTGNLTFDNVPMLFFETYFTMKTPYFHIHVSITWIIIIIKIACFGIVVTAYTVFYSSKNNWKYRILCCTFRLMTNFIRRNILVYTGWC